MEVTGLNSLRVYLLPINCNKISNTEEDWLLFQNYELCISQVNKMILFGPE
jgi:hypothetical protein